MASLSDNYYSKDELLQIAAERGIKKVYFDELIPFVEKDIQEMTNDGDLPENELGTIALNFAVEYFTIYDKEIQKGHSSEWAKLYAESIEDHPHAFNDTYKAIRSINPEKALEELKVHCRCMEGDELYTKYFIYLMEEGEGPRSPDRKALLYSDIYKEKIQEGNSPTFSHEYADNMAKERYTELYCYSLAKEFEQAVNQGKSKEYAWAYSRSIASYIANYYVSYEAAMTDELYWIEKAAIEKQLSHMK